MKPSGLNITLLTIFHLNLVQPALAVVAQPRTLKPRGAAPRAQQALPQTPPCTEPQSRLQEECTARRLRATPAVRPRLEARNDKARTRRALKADGDTAGTGRRNATRCLGPFNRSGDLTSSLLTARTRTPHPTGSGSIPASVMKGPSPSLSAQRCSERSGDYCEENDSASPSFAQH